MSLLIEMRFNGQPLATGTAFVTTHANRAYLITNRHNVTGRDQHTGQPLNRTTGGVPNEIVVVHNAPKLGEWVLRIEALYDANDQPRWYEHPTLGAKADFVALPLTQLDGVQLHAYAMNTAGPNILLGPAEVVSVIGFPFGMTAGGAMAVWATGFVASELDIDFASLPVFLIDCRSRQGQSGSAVIAHRAGGMVAMADGGSAVFDGPVFRFLGIYSGRINPESDLGMVWKRSAIAELLASIP